MKYIKLVLRGYKRLLLNNINEVIFKPESNIQLILGTNGSGKSSLLRELSPIPANIKQDYNDKGFKEITIEQDGVIYVLTTKYVNTAIKSSFIIKGNEDEELNRSGTKSIQNTLVERYFRTNNDIHDLMTGVKGFSNLSVAERKKWFTRLSDIDYTYPLSVYKKLSERHRDIKGGIKLLNGKLCQEEEKSLSESSIADIRDKLKHLNKIVNDSLERKTPVEYSKDIVDKDIVTMSGNINKYSELLSKENLVSVHEDAKNIEVSLKYIEEDKNVLMVEISELESRQSLISKAFSTDTNVLSNTLVSLKNKINEIIDKIHLPYNKIPMAMELSSVYKRHVDNLVSIMESMPESSRTDLTVEFYNDKVLLKQDYQCKLSNVSLDIEKVSLSIKEIEHFKDCSEVECPECNSKWVPGYSKEKIDRLRTKLTEMTDTSNIFRSDLESCEEWLTEYKEYVNLRTNIKTITDSTVDLSFLWINIFGANLLSDQNNITNKLFKIEQELPLWIEAFNITKDIKKLEEDIDLVKKERNLGTVSLEKDIMNKTTFLESRITEIEIKTIELSKLKSLIASMNGLERLSMSLSKLIYRYKENGISEEKRLFNNSLNDIIAFSRSEITNYERLLNNSNNHESLVNSIRGQILDLEQREVMLTNMIKKLSPTEGLIAKGMIGFIELFVNDMNTIINKVWTYRLEVQSCKIDSERGLDLDYRFPVSVDGTNTPTDVSKTSASMKEVIDLAFKISSMKYLGMIDHPLYLDEYGRAMDATHVIEAYNVVDTLINSDFEQIYMVSHFESCFGRFKHADVSVLSADNINISKDMIYNEVLEIR